MATRGFLIRFIDIGLIVLFGFLMISDIEMASRVELASEAAATEFEVPPVDADHGFIVVEVGADGAFRVGDSPEADGPRTETHSTEALTDALRAISERHAGEGLESIVLIQPHPASLVQATVDVMDVCDRLALPKSLQMDIEIVAEPGDPREGAP